MTYTPYQFPAFPNAETRDNNNPLRSGKITPVLYAVPNNVAIQNVNPNVYNPSSAYNQPGKQSFEISGSYAQWLDDQDNEHRENTITINQPLLYRSNLGVPRHESGTYRIRTPSVTRPINTATFNNGSKGDIYGG